MLRRAIIGNMDLSQIINAIVLGIVEGITEFLPISSTGHLIIFNQWFRFSDPAFTKLFDIVIQAGAIFSVIIFFRKKLFPVYRDQTPEIRGDIRSLWLKAVIAFLPAALIGILAKHFIDEKLMQPLVVAIALAFWGAFIVFIETRNNQALKAGRPFKFDTVKSLTIPIVIAIGYIQCLGMNPGTSRSAATIIGAMLLGASRIASAEFSFFLAIPTILGASVYSLFDYGKKVGFHLGKGDLISLAIGTLVAFLVAWAVVAFLMNFIRKHDFRGFGWYRIALGLGIIVLIALGVQLGT